ncbi:MAG: GTP-binding protein HflX [Brockia lithotrophica]|uniref:GTPase HflX n=1 Tax=Brockia lithotrophica TaxID=933949 RepID=A0A2T5G7Q6_9BACL|nr:MAG: GTP-binding protein HflX [Brockia lithotrophica]
MGKTPRNSSTPARTRALLAAFFSPEDWGERESRLAEDRRLAETAGAEVVATVVHRREKPEAATLFGRGKIEEIRTLLQDVGAELVLVNRSLTPTQLRNLERAWELPVVDRVQLILDIFAQRARTRESQIQVELAQLQYLLPRLAGRGESLSRLGGGIGTRGPGETKLEVDQRRIRRRIHLLRKRLEEVERSRATQRRTRLRRGVPQVALVGYTNAGKSTLFRALTGADVLVEDRLFATLDTAARRLRLPSGRTVVLLDTVGFVRDLPTFLVAAFRSTLEVVREADLLLHVVDVSEDDWEEKMRVAEEHLSALGAQDIPRLLLLNKKDRLPPEKWPTPAGLFPDSSRAVLLLSATDPHDLARLRTELDSFFARAGTVSLEAPPPPTPPA